MILAKDPKAKLMLLVKMGDEQVLLYSRHQRETLFQYSYWDLLLLFSRSVVSDSLRPHGLQHTRPPCPSPSPRACSNSCPLSRGCHPTISSPSPPAFSLSQHQGLFQWVGSSHLVGEILELQLQRQSFQWVFRIYFFSDWLIWSPCSPRGSQESSPIPQFKSINSLMLSFLYGPTLTSIHAYWKNHSFD